MRKWTLAFVLVAAFAFGACSDDDPVVEDAVITIDNDTLDVTVIEINLALSPNGSYGPDELPTDLLPGDVFDIVVDPEIYDVRLTSDLGEVCEVLDVDVLDLDYTFFVSSCTFI